MSNSNVKIEKNIPLPDRGNVLELPLKEMEKGDSISVPIHPDSKTREVKTLRQRISRFQSGNPDYRFTISKDPAGDGMRVWRVF